MKIGVLALQGTFAEHIAAVEKLDAWAVEVRRPADLAGVCGIIIPGGESTAITRLMGYYGLFEPLKKLADQGVPFMGTCAGMICMASDAGNYRNLEILKLMDIEVDRNAFGRQTASFETPLDIPLLGPEPFPGLFIRGPKIKKAGPRVNILSRLEDGTEVAARQDNLLAMAFHPELVEDLRMHRYFVQMAADFELIKA